MLLLVAAGQCRSAGSGAVVTLSLLFIMSLSLTPLIMLHHTLHYISSGSKLCVDDRSVSPNVYSQKTKQKAQKTSKSGKTPSITKEYLQKKHVFLYEEKKIHIIAAITLKVSLHHLRNRCKLLHLFFFGLKFCYLY